MKIGVLITTVGPIDPIIYHNHLSVFLDWKKRYDLEVYHIQDTQQECSLNAMVKAATADNCDYLFFAEHDNIYLKDTLPRLLKHDLDCVSGYYTFRNYPFAPIPLKRNEQDGLLYRLEYAQRDNEEEDIDNLIEVTVACFGCLLVKTSVIKKLTDAGLIFRREYDKKTFSSLTTDCVFFKDLKSVGIKIHVDGHVRVGHLGQRIVITPDNYLIYRELIKIIMPGIIPVEELLSPKEQVKRIAEILEVPYA